MIKKKLIFQKKILKNVKEILKMKKKVVVVQIVVVVVLVVVNAAKKKKKYMKILKNLKMQYVH